MEKNKLLNDDSISFWLKKQLVELEQRDPLDVLNDLELLICYTEKRVEDNMN